MLTGLVAGSIAGNGFAVTKVYVAIGGNQQTLVADLPTSIALYAIAGSLLGYILYRIAFFIAAARRRPITR